MKYIQYYCVPKREEILSDEKVKEFQYSAHYCHQLNVSQCWVTERAGADFVINIYNSLGHYINTYIRIPVIQEYNETVYAFRVIDSNGKLFLIRCSISLQSHLNISFGNFEGTILQSQLMPIASFVASIPGRNSIAKHELIFLATKLPPIGSRSYYIETSVSKGRDDPSISVPVWSSFYPSDQITDSKISNEVP